MIWGAFGEYLCENRITKWDKSHNSEGLTYIDFREGWEGDERRISGDCGELVDQVGGGFD